MKAATSSKRFGSATKLAVLHEGARAVEHKRVGDLVSLFGPGDLLVVNTAGTLPSSFRGTVAGKSVELRLASFAGSSLRDLSKWRGVLFGSGSWQVPTEHRGVAPVVAAGDTLIFDGDLSAVVGHVDPEFPRLVDISFRSSQLISSLYRCGRPIQYSYLRDELEVWDQQTIFSGVPISVEPPSASFPLTWRLMFDLQKRGARIAPLVHGAGLSSTGDANFDKRFPLDEYFEIPESTAEAVSHAERVVAVGTSACRALESWSFAGQLRGRTQLRIDSMTDLRVTDALITGMHEPETSHFDLMGAFGETSFLARETSGYRSHEYGDLTLMFRAETRRE